MNFFYEAVDESGKTVLGKLDAESEIEVQQRLLQLGYRPQSIAANPMAAGAPAPPVVPAVPPVNAAPPMPALPAPQPLSAGPGFTTPAVPQATMMQHFPTQSQPMLTMVNGGSTGAGVAALNTQGVLTVPASGTRAGNITMAGNAAKLQTSALVARPVTKLPTLTNPVNPNASPLGGVSTREMMLFFQQLAQLVKSGMSVYSALENLGPRTPNKNLRTAATEMAQAARNGEAVSGVLEKYPRIFPEWVVGMVRAGELGGFLEISLAEVALNYEQNIALYRHAWIPKLMATQAFLMLALAIPLFTSLYKADFNPVIFLTLYLKQLAVVLTIFGAIYFGSKLLGRRLQLPQFRYLRDSLSLKLPPFGDLQRRIALASFTRTLRRLYQSGVAPIHAWEGAMHSATNVVIKDRLESAYGLMQQGASLPDAFTATGLFASDIENLVITGQHSGEVVESLDRVADYYEQQADEAAGKSKFAILRFGILAMILFGGGAMIWMAHTYFNGMFEWVDRYFKVD